MPDFMVDWFLLEPWAIALIVVLVVAFLALVIWRGILVHRRRISAGSEGLIGKTARVRTELQPEGTVFIQGELWNAVSEEGNVESGEEVTITGVDNLVLSVIPSHRSKVASNPGKSKEVSE